MKKDTLKHVLPFYKEYASTVGKHDNQNVEGRKKGHLWQNAVYAVVYEKAGLSRVNYHYCYGKFQGGYLRRPDDKAESILLQVQPWQDIQTEESVRMYYEWLLNDSPWSSIFVTKSVNKLLTKKIAVVDASSPSNIIAGGGIAFRQVWENYWGSSDADYASDYKRIPVWAELVKNGVDASVALAIVSTLKVTDSTVAMCSADSGHCVLPSGDSQVLSNFILDNKAGREGDPWNQTYWYNGGNSYLYGGSKKLIADIRADVEKNLNSIGGKEKNTNPFAQKTKSREWKIGDSLEALIDVSKNISSLMSPKEAA